MSDASAFDVLAHTISCVCVHSDSRKSPPRSEKNQESPEGGMCAISHTRFLPALVSKCSSVVNHFASREGGETPQSASRVLALFGVIR